MPNLKKHTPKARHRISFDITPEQAKHLHAFQAEADKKGLKLSFRKDFQNWFDRELRVAERLIKEAQ